MERQLAHILLDHSDLGVMVIDAETRVRLWNEWLIHRTGKTREEALGKRLEDLFPDLPPQTRQALDQVLSTGQPRILSPIVCPTYFPFPERMRQFVRLAPLFLDPHLHLVVLIQDVTSQLEYEEALEERFRLMREGIKDYSLVLLDERGNVTGWDSSAERLFGYAAVEMVGKPFSRLFPEGGPEQERRDLYLKTTAKTGRWEDQLKVRRKDERSFTAQLVLSALKDRRGGIRGYSLMIRDMSEHLEAQKALWDSLAQRRRLEKEREQTLEKLRQAVQGAVAVISQTVEMRDPYTAGHQNRVAALTEKIALEMGFSSEKAEGVRMAGSIHDLGKISIPAEILVKPSRLNELEYRLIRIHPESGYQILKNIDFPWPIAEMVLQHHERMDGSGYPQGLKGEAISREARILAVADVVEAMASHRPYRPARGVEAALEEIERNQGSLYDPVVVSACLRLFREKGFRWEQP